VTIWILETPAGAEPSFVFRILPGSQKTVGRAAGADFIVDAGMVSRAHCRLSATSIEVEVLDLGSTNGTYVNGQRITRALLRHGDQLDIGRVSLLVVQAQS
jgi:pSer/pThr/pTyr-binding forkhead associated (FHA) protein